LSLSSCFGEESAQRLPGFEGRAGEVVVAMSDSYWNGAAGEAVKDALSSPYPMLPQLEPSFSVIHTREDDLSYTERFHRNLILIDIGPLGTDESAKATQTPDRWAQGQMTYLFRAESEEQFLAQWSELSESVMKDMHDRDLGRVTSYMREIEHPGAYARLQNEMELGLVLHKDFGLREHSKDFTWYSRDRVISLSGVGHDVIQSIAVYTYPYTSDSLLRPEALIAKRNEVMGKHITSVSDSGMTVETLLPPEVMQVPFNGQYALEMRGLWKFPSPIMGGPFVSLTVVDEKRARVITVEGYVFAPKFDKRPYMHDIEAIVYSLTY